MAGRGFTTSWRAMALLGQCAVLALSTAACATAAPGGSANAVGDWPTLGHDPGGSRFSRLTQINPSNVAQLREAWVYNMRRPTDRPAAGGGPFGEGGGPPPGAPAGPPALRPRPAAPSPGLRFPAAGAATSGRKAATARRNRSRWWSTA